MKKEALHIDAYRYDDDIIEATRHDRRPRMAVYRLAGTAVVLGRGSDLEKELNIQACLADGIPVLRRRGGGCAVVIDPGNVIVSLVLPVSGIGGHIRHFRALSSWLIRGLRNAGVEGLSRQGISDLAVDGKKAGGACMYRPKDFLHYSASLLVDPDLDRVARYLRHPPREPAYRQGRGHGDFMTSLNLSSWPGSAEALAFALRSGLRAEAGLKAVLTGVSMG